MKENRKWKYSKGERKRKLNNKIDNGKQTSKKEREEYEVLKSYEHRELPSNEQICKWEKKLKNIKRKLNEKNTEERIQKLEHKYKSLDGFMKSCMEGKSPSKRWKKVR